MKYTKFIIRKYKAVSNVEISLEGNDLIPIIGINESGKTSILHAIFAFDKINDKLMGGLHLDAKNRYEYDSTGHIVTAEIVLDKDKDLDIIKDKLNIKKSHKFYKELLELRKVEGRIRLSRNLDSTTREYNIENEFAIGLEVKKQLIDLLLKQSPFILLFDDFTDRVPEAISFPPSYIGDL